MKALVYHGPGQISWDEKPLPKIQEPTDAIVKISKTTLCGTDLSILKGGVPSCEPGRVLGHEGTGYITEVGSGVTNCKVGDHVMVSCVTSCGRCQACRDGLFSACERGGWLLGNTVDGLQAEYARIPFADTNLYRIPSGMCEEAALMLCDIVPTGLEIGAQMAGVSLGDTVVVIGAGPVGLATILAAQFYTPAQIVVIDLDDNRLAKAKEIGATITINNSDGKAIDEVMRLTEGRGADAVIEVVGAPATFELAQQIVCAGGRMANVGVFTKSVELHTEVLWARNITLRMGLVNTNTVPVLLKMLHAGKLDPTRLISHHFRLDEIVKAYDIFKNAAREQAIKIVLSSDDASEQARPVSQEEIIAQIVNKVLASF